VKKNPIHKQRLLGKYSGLKWYDMDEDGALITVIDGEICFYKDGMAKGYHVFGVHEGFDMDLGISTRIILSCIMCLRGVSVFTKILLIITSNIQIRT